MAEVSSVLREMQLDTEGGLVPARGSVPLYSRRRPKLVKDDSAAIGVTKAELANKKAGGTSMVKAASWSDFGTCGFKPTAGNKTAPGSEPGPKEERKAPETTKADAGNKEAAGSFTGKIDVTFEIGVAKAEPANKDAAGSFTGEICVTKAEPGNKGKIVDTVAVVGNRAWKGVVTEKDWLESIFLTKPPVGIESKAAPTGATITKEVVPVSFVEKLKSRRRFKRLPPINTTTGMYDRFPKCRDANVAFRARWNYLVDLHEDVLRQDALNGFAEVGVDFTDGVKKIFILPESTRAS